MKLITEPCKIYYLDGPCSFNHPHLHTLICAIFFSNLNFNHKQEKLKNLTMIEYYSKTKTPPNNIKKDVTF